LLALNGLQVSEATGANIENLSVVRGHRTLVITRKGGKVVTIPLAPRTARAIDLAIGERVEGPIFLSADGQRLDRRRRPGRPPPGPPRGNHQTGRAAHPAACVHHRRPRRRVPLRDVQEAASHADPHTTMRYDRARTSLDRHATYIVAAYVRCRPVTRRKGQLLASTGQADDPLQLLEDHRATPANRNPRGCGGTYRSPGPGSVISAASG
jgi:integrase